MNIAYPVSEILKCIEIINHYILLVNWQTLDDHTEGSRESKEYQERRKSLHHFYGPLQEVDHYQSVYNNAF